ncbi:hypothetical protein EN00_020255 [Vibrio parahaemolyticus]|nr:hypothetical protein EN00_020255 [Vibrio parahaemolyticus]
MPRNGFRSSISSLTKRLRQIPNAWHFSFYRWFLCLRWHSQVQWWRCSLLNAALYASCHIVVSRIIQAEV